MHDFAAFVEAALGTHAMGHAWLLAIRANGCLRLPQSIMRPALARAGLGMTTFWIRHKDSEFVNSKWSMVNREW